MERESFCKTKWIFRIVGQYIYLCYITYFISHFPKWILLPLYTFCLQLLYIFMPYHNLIWFAHSISQNIFKRFHYRHFSLLNISINIQKKVRWKHGFAIFIIEKRVSKEDITILKLFVMNKWDCEIQWKRPKAWKEWLFLKPVTSHYIFVLCNPYGYFNLNYLVQVHLWVMPS